MTEKILAFGASGKFSGLVFRELVSRGADLRAFVRRPEQGESLGRQGASEFAVGDLTNRVSVERALDGVTNVFYLAPVFLRDQAELGRQLVDSAVAAGVKRFVFSSVIHPVLSALPNHAAKALVEEAILNSGLEFTFLHPAVFFQNYAAYGPRIVETGVIAEPWSPDTRFSRVDYRDVAEVAAIALTDGRLKNGTFELCAEGELNRHDVAAIIAEGLGRKVEVARTDPATLGGDAALLQPMFAHYDRHWLIGNPLTLRAILGREPRTLRGYFQKLAGQPPKGS
jgi:uncharacterized protein YbjT (DUF2867 family)